MHQPKGITGPRENCFETNHADSKFLQSSGPYEKVAQMVIDETACHAIPIEVYLPFTVIRGTLVTRHSRVSSHLNLRLGDEAFVLKGAGVEDANGNCLPMKSDEYLVYLHEVLFIADLSLNAVPVRSALDQERIPKEPMRVFLHVSPFWIRGTVHLIPGAKLTELLIVKKRFIPVTDAVVVNRPFPVPRTFLVNGARISCLTADGASKI